MPGPDESDAPDALMTPGQVAALFHVTAKTVSRWHQAGILPAHRTIGGHRRFPVGPVYELMDLLEAFRDPLPEDGEEIEA